jgi:hypothetical protein
VVLGLEAVDVLRVDLPAGRVVFDFSVRSAVGRLERADAVREHQPVPAPRMFEVVADAPLLAQPLEELKVALVELGLVVAHRIGLGQSPVYRKAIAPQQRIEDLHDRLVLEDAAVRAQSGQVQPGAQRELVLHVAPLLAPQRRIGDERVDLAGCRAVELDLAADFPADEAIEVELRRPRQHQLIGKEPIHPFLAGKPHRLQHGTTKDNRNGGRRNRQRARHRRLPSQR